MFVDKEGNEGCAAELQKEHYKSDWHRYNLKRKVADLPPVTAENFQQRVLAQKEQVGPATVICLKAGTRYFAECGKLSRGNLQKVRCRFFRN